MAKQETFNIDDLVNGALSQYIKPIKTEVLTAAEFNKVKKSRKKTSPKLFNANEPCPYDELPEGVYHIKLEGLPKWSTNQMYAGGAYYSRKAIKDKYKKSILQQFNKVVRFKCICVYEFFFKSRALDSSNCSGMAKMIEDCILPSDSFRMVGGVYLSSSKGERDYVIVHVFPVGAIDELVQTITDSATTFANMKIDSHNRVVI